MTPEGQLLSQQVLERGSHTLTVPPNISGEVLLRFENQAGSDATYMLRGFESQAPEPFNIDLEFGEGLTASQKRVIQAAAKSIESLIRQGLPSAIVDGKIIDDINFKISAGNLDGSGGTLCVMGRCCLLNLLPSLMLLILHTGIHSRLGLSG